MRLAVVLLAALFAVAVPAASHPAADRCAASIPDPGDTDCDGARTDGPSPADNCPEVRNADQGNTDGPFSPADPAAADGSTKPMASGDGAGDACDDDDDADGVPDAQDNCRIVRNPDQFDEPPGDGRGDAPDGTDLCPPTDGDGDGTIDEDDNCPTIANRDQADFDRDRRGDVCEYDDDGDNVSDGTDNCPMAANSEQADRDGDGIGTACDAQEIPPAETATFEPDRRPPVVRLSTASRRGPGDVRGRLPTAVSCSEACVLSATLRYAGGRRAVAQAELGGDGRTWLFFTFRRGAIARIPRRGVRATLEVVASDAAGNRARATRRVRLLR
jgi:hypothetical protein